MQKVAEEVWIRCNDNLCKMAINQGGSLYGSFFKFDHKSALQLTKLLK
jgi:hypothetical protein